MNASSNPARAKAWRACSGGHAGGARAHPPPHDIRQQEKCCEKTRQQEKCFEKEQCSRAPAAASPHTASRRKHHAALLQAAFAESEQRRVDNRLPPDVQYGDSSMCSELMQVAAAANATLPRTSATSSMV
jgi:hypothetical protein